MKYNLEWYVLNYCPDYRGGCEEKFKHYPYSSGDIKPFNVFNNWVFRDEAIKLAKEYKKGEIKSWNWVEDFPQNKSLFEQFKYALMRALSCEEHGRFEYEILVSPWHDYKDLEQFEKEHQLIDCYQQVLPNADQFAKYVLTKVNGGDKNDKNGKV